MNDITKYKKMIRSMFPIYGPYEKRFYSDLKQNIAEFVDNRENIEFSDLQEEFGSPAAIIQDYLDNVNSDYLIKQLSRTKYIRISCFFVILGIISILAVWSITNYFSYKSFQDNLPAIEQTTIEYIN